MRTFLIAALLALTVCADIEKDENFTFFLFTKQRFCDIIKNGEF